MALLSSDSRFKSTFKHDGKKIDKYPFDFENSHYAKLCILNPPERSPDDPKTFTIKSRYCYRCTKKCRYFCQPDKNWEFEQDLGSFQIVSTVFHFP